MDPLEQARSRPWYHTIELPGLTTRGVFDLRPFVYHYGLPESLAGKRALDVGTWDGFWAFELERRGAGEVLALDIDDERDLDWPPLRRPATFPTVSRGANFFLARDLLGSRVERVTSNIYDATPESLGAFDLVLCGSMLMHLRDPLLGIERLAGLLRPGGLLISVEEYDRVTGVLPFPAARFLRGNSGGAVVFWLPSRRAWRAMLRYAGLEKVREVARFTMRSTEGWGVRHAVHHARRSSP